MDNIKYALTTEGKDVVLTITAKLPKKGEDSKSGKSLLYATSNGNFNTGLKVNGVDLIAGINVYTKKA